METNNPFKVGDIVYHYSTKEDVLIIESFSKQELYAHLKNFNTIKTSELSFKPYDLVNGGLTHIRPVDFSILNETDWFYIVIDNFGSVQKWYSKGNMFQKDISINYSLDCKSVYRNTKLCKKEMVASIRKCTEQELEEIKTIFPEEFKPKTLFERIEHEVKMSSSPVSGIIISDQEDEVLPSSYFFGPIHETKLARIYVSKTNMPKGKIILF